MAVAPKQIQQLKDENKALRARLAQAEMALEAIRNGQVDAPVGPGVTCKRIYTTEDSGQLYRVMLESMQEGAAALTLDGLILYCNRRLAEMLHHPLEKVQGAWLSQFLNPTDWMRFRHLLEDDPKGYKFLEASLLFAGGGRLPVHLTFGMTQAQEMSSIVVVVSDQTEHQQLEQALRDSEALYRTLVESSEASIAVLDKNGSYLFANAELAGRLGRSPEDVAGMNLADFFPPEIANRQVERVRAVLASQQGQVHESIALVDGKPRIYRASIQPILGASGRPVLALLHEVDVTDVRLAQEEVAASAARYQSLFENTPVALTEMNITAVYQQVDRLQLQGVTDIRLYASQQPDFIAQIVQSIQLEDANRAALDLFAAESKPALFGRWRAVLAPEGQEFLLVCLEALVEQRRELTIEASMFTLVGERKELLVRLQLEQRDLDEYLLAAFTDITQRKQAEHLLQTQAEQIRALAENSPDFIARFDRDHRYLYLNRPLANTQAGQIAAEVGVSLDDIEPPTPEIEQRKQKIEQVFQTGQPTRLEFALLGENGTVWFDARFVPEFAADGSVASVLVISRDITGLKQSETTLKKLNRALAMLNECNSVLAHADDEQQLLNEICCLIVESGGYRMSWVGLAEQDSGKTVRPVAVCGFEDGYLASARISWADNERGRGPTGGAIREGKLQINHNFAANPIMTPWREAALQRGYQSSIVLPLKDGQTTFGALTLYSAVPDAFDADEAGLLSQLADDLAFGMIALRERHARRRAQETAHKWEHIFQHAKWGVVVGSADGKTLELMNSEFARMHGYTVEELTGKSILEVFAPEERPGLFGRIQQAHQSGHFVYDSMHLRKDGSTFPASVEVTVVKDDNGQILYRVVNVWDISERKQVEEMLRFSEARFATVFRSSPLSIAITRMSDYKLVDVNDAWLNQTGFTREEALDHTSSELKCWGIPSEREELFRKAGEQQTVRDFEFHLRKKSGALVDILLTAELIDLAGQPHLLSMGLDITERKRMEMALQQANQTLEERVAARTSELRESELRFQLALRNAPVTVAAQDKDLRFTWAYNQRTVDPAAVLGKTDADIFASETAAVLVPLKLKVLETGQEIRQQLWVTSNGRRVFLDLFLEPLRDDGGKIIGVGIATVDLTQFKLAEEALRESEESLRQSQAELEQKVKDRTAALETLNQELKQAAFARELAEGTQRQQGYLLENICEAVYSSTLDFTVQTWNKAAESMYGYTALEMIGKDSREILKTHIQSPVEDAQLVLAQDGCWRGELLQTRKDGVTIRVDGSTSLLKDASGKLIGMVTIARQNLGLNNRVSRRR